jgi:hypothetical protein
MSNDVTLEMLAQRLIALERQNRRLKQTFAGALVGALVGAITILAATGISARRSPGRPSPPILCRWWTRKDAPRATIENSPATAQGNPLLTFFPIEAATHGCASASARGGPTLEAIDENGKTKDFFGPPYARPLTQ